MYKLNQEMSKENDFLNHFDFNKINLPKTKKIKLSKFKIVFSAIVAITTAQIIDFYFVGKQIDNISTELQSLNNKAIKDLDNYRLALNNNDSLTAIASLKDIKNIQFSPTKNVIMSYNAFPTIILANVYENILDGKGIHIDKNGKLITFNYSPELINYVKSDKETLDTLNTNLTYDLNCKIWSISCNYFQNKFNFNPLNKKFYTMKQEILYKESHPKEYIQYKNDYLNWISTTKDLTNMPKSPFEKYQKGEF